ncbi:MAG: GMP synthase (glutamine-hydrolyzing), partial [Myxococcota bacterium]
MSATADRILILDFGSQTTQLIARRVREAGVYCDIRPFSEPIDKIREFGPRGIILSGGPASVYDEHAPTPDAGIFELDVPVLGICYGMQTLTQHCGGRVEPSDHREFGRAQLVVNEAIGPLKNFAAVPDISAAPEVVWMSHGDRLMEVPPGWRIIATTTNGVPAAIASPDRPFFGLQFHPEVVHTPRGAEMIHTFVVDVCRCETTWT